MNRWLIIHEYNDYLTHPDIIGLYVKLDEKTGARLKDKKGRFLFTPRNADKVKVGDHIAYYCKKGKNTEVEMAIIGLFEITEGPGVFSSDWSDSVHYKIQPLHTISKEKIFTFDMMRAKLKFFQGKDGIPYSKRAAGWKLQGSVFSLKPEDFELLKEFFETKKKPDKKPIKSEEDESAEFEELGHLLFTFEKKIRYMIKTVLSKRFGEEWWSRAISSTIQKEVERNIAQQKKKDELKGEFQKKYEKVDFLDFSRYNEILMKRWKLFEKIFPNKNDVDSWLREISDARNPIAHHREHLDYAERSICRKFMNRILSFIQKWEKSQ